MPVLVGQVVAVVRELARDSSKVRTTRHASERMVEREITLAQVLRVLRVGVATEGPFVNIEGDWQVNLTGRDSGDEITVTTILQESDVVIVRTVM
jgi:hypothetical protein